MGKKVVVHALGATMGGARRHLTSFLPHLGSVDPSNEYEVLVRHSFPQVEPPPNVRLTRVRDVVAANKIQRTWFDSIELPRRLSKSGAATLVSLTNFGPIWSPVPHVFFQRNPVYYCPYYLKRVSPKLRLEAFLRRSLAVASMLRAEIIVTPSNAMASMIKEACPQTRNLTFVTLYHGFDPCTACDPLAAEYRKLVDRVTGAKLLYPTHPAPHKGFEVIFRALQMLKKRGVDATLLTTIEHKDWPQGVSAYNKMILELEISDRVVFMGAVPQDQMAELYKACDLMVYPSLCESFGFSMVEAMGYGLPIVAAGTQINKEICEAAAVYYAPLEAEEAADRIEEALERRNSDDLRLRAKSRMAAYDWGWSRYSREFAGIVQQVL